MRSAGPDPDIATSYPPATAARAKAVPALPAPTIPRRRSVDSLLDTGCVRGRRDLVVRCRLLRRIREQLPDARDHLPSVQLDGRHLMFVWYSPRRIGQVEAAEPEEANDPCNFGRDGFHRSEIQRSFVDLGLESIHRRSRPSALGRSLLEDMSPMRPLNVRGFLVGSGYEPVGVHTDALQRLSVFLEGSLVELNQRQEPDRRPADNGQHEREAVARGSDNRLGTAANSNPHGQMALREGRAEVLVCERRAELSRPGDGLVSQQAHEQVELLLEEVLVIVEVVTEERE